MQEAKYIALRDFDGFKKGDAIPAEFVQDRLIRGRKIGLVDGTINSAEKKEELITEVVEVVKPAESKEELLIEDSSDVSVEIKEETVQDVSEVPAKETKKSKKEKINENI